jgi:hypothetical protein
MANTVIVLKKSGSPGVTPSALSNGELAINYADGKLFYKNATGSIVSFSTGTGGGGNAFTTVNVNNTLVVATTPTSTISLLPGNNVTVVGDGVANKATIGFTPAGGVDFQDNILQHVGFADYMLKANSLGNITGATTIDINYGNYFYATVTGTITWTFASPPPTGNAAGFILRLTNGGSAPQIWPTSVKWPTGTVPTLTTSGVDILTFITDDVGTSWRGVLSILDSR